MVAEITSSSSPAQCPIKTVVVLVQENRSFDHMLGWMKSLNPHLDGVTGSESNPVSTSDTNSPLVYFGDTSGYVDPDPGHSIQAIFEQVFGLTWPQYTSSSSSSSDAYDNNDPITLRPEMKGFAQNAERIEKGMSASVMNGFRPEKVPVYKELVAEFGVCDRWFASVPASTQPNRMYVHSATSHGATSNDVKKLVEGFPQKTVFESLDETGLSFGIYYQYPPATLFFRNLRKLKYLKNLYQFDVHFKRDCEEGKLPNYVVIEQRYFDLLSVPANDDHPSHDVSEGQKFVKQVYEALRGSPQWHEILFVITYDEHGGFYDHVPTPVTGVPSPDGIVGPDPYNFKFDRLGVRVPTFFISPWIERGTVLHRPSGPTLTSEFEHSSIPATVKKIFNLKDFLTKRDAWAGTFETVLNRTIPRTDCPVTLPEPELKLRAGDADEDTKLSDFQQELVLMAAALIGDGRVVGNMKVGEGAKYVEDAFDRFKYHCEKAMARGVDESEILLLPPTSAAIAKERESKSFGRKLLACLACNN